MSQDALDHLVWRKPAKRSFTRELVKLPGKEEIERKEARKFEQHVAKQRVLLGLA